MTNLKPGWYPDSKSPTSVRYWDGEEWGAVAPKPSEGMSTRKLALGVAWGLITVLALVWFIYNLTQPSDFDCEMQEIDVLVGKLSQVERDCR